MAKLSVWSNRFLCVFAATLLFVAQSDALEACCADLGCFSSDRPFFHLLYRPVLTVPNCDILPRLKLYLNTRENPVDPDLLDPYTIPSIVHSKLRADRETKILIHGHTDNYDWAWWKDIRTELLLEEDFNVIRVDWSAGNTPPYIQAIANSRLVGAFVAKFIGILRDRLNFDVAKIHVIGHSLGAQTAGYVGERVHLLGRITGLDPAGPGFGYMPPEVRLDPTDAVVVDTIVSDGVAPFRWGFGSNQAMGHLNFYPNGGSNQPGCDNGPLDPFISGPTQNSSSFGFIDSLVASSYEALACSHIRALTMFLETISSRRCSMKAFQCDSYSAYQRGDCFTCQGVVEGEKCSIMGVHANLSRAEQGVLKNYYVESTDTIPFCASAFKVQIKLQARNNINDARTEKGQLFMKIYGTLGTTERAILTAEDTDFSPGQTLIQMTDVPFVNELGNIQSVVFSWKSKRSLLPTEWLRRKYLHIDGNFELINDKGVRTVLRPTRSTVEDGTDLLANIIM